MTGKGHCIITNSVFNRSKMLIVKLSLYSYMIQLFNVMPGKKNVSYLNKCNLHLLVIKGRIFFSIFFHSKNNCQNFSCLLIYPINLERKYINRT